MAHSIVDGYSGPKNAKPRRMGKVSAIVEKRGYGIEARAREILLLSKMNWNSSDGITRLPVTLLFAKRVREIMTELSDNVAPNPSFRFHT